MLLMIGSTSKPTADVSSHERVPPSVRVLQKGTAAAGLLQMSAVLSGAFCRCCHPCFASVHAAAYAAAACCGGGQNRVPLVLSVCAAESLSGSASDRVPRDQHTPPASACLPAEMATAAKLKMLWVLNGSPCPTAAEGHVRMVYLAAAVRPKQPLTVFCDAHLSLHTC